MPHLFWSNKGKNSVVAKRTNPYLSTSARPGIHQLSQNTSNASPSVYRETVLKKDQSTRIGLVSIWEVLYYRNSTGLSVDLFFFLEPEFRWLLIT